MRWEWMTSLGVIALLALASAFAADDSKVEVKGMIISRTGEMLIVNGPKGKTTVVLTDETRTKDDKGPFGLEKQQMADTVLIPGLKIDVDGVSDDQGRVVAKTITVD